MYIYTEWQLHVRPSIACALCLLQWCGACRASAAGRRFLKTKTANPGKSCVPSDPRTGPGGCQDVLQQVRLGLHAAVSKINHITAKLWSSKPAMHVDLWVKFWPLNRVQCKRVEKRNQTQMEGWKESRLEVLEDQETRWLLLCFFIVWLKLQFSPSWTVMSWSGAGSGFMWWITKIYQLDQ